MSQLPLYSFFFSDSVFFCVLYYVAPTMLGLVGDNNACTIECQCKQPMSTGDESERTKKYMQNLLSS